MAITAQNINQKPGYKLTEVGIIPEDWEVILLDSVAKRGSGHTPNKKHPEYWDGDIKWISLKDSDRLDALYISETAARITPAGIANSSAVLHPEGTVVLSRDAGVGKSAITTEVMAVSQHFMAWQCGPRLDNHFLYYWLQAEKSEFERIAIGNTIKTIGLPYFKKLEISLPPSNEQHAIVAALGDVDALIMSLDQLIVKKRDIKQATMQQLLTGKKRLPGFGGEGKVMKLEEIGEKFVNGGTPSTQKPEYWQGNIPWITGADIINQKISDIRRFITSEAVKNSSTNIVERGNLLLVTRTGVGKLAVAPFDVAISQDITGIYVKKGQALVEYLFHYFNYNSESLKSLNQGTSIAGITRETLLSTNVYLPSFPEQKAIADILSDMDAEIVALEQKRDKTCALKQGMMQELLTGKTRLV